LKHWRVWLVPAAAALAFILVYFTDTNRTLFMALNTLGPATSDWLWANVTVLGDAMVGFALCLPLWRRRPDLLWAFAFVVLFGTLWVHGLKPFIDVARPPAVLGEQVHVIGRAYQAHSFPSGHATTAFAIAGLLALGLRSRLWGGAIVLLAFAVALSRAVLGVHWPLDILAGIFGGWLSAVIALWIAQRTRRLGMHPLAQWTLAAFVGACAIALVLGYPKDYPQAEWLQRAIGLACLAAAGLTCSRGARLKRASLYRHSDL
jgi:membrane-associated phospholipid phosphatase